MKQGRLEARPTKNVGPLSGSLEIANHYRLWLTGGGTQSVVLFLTGSGRRVYNHDRLPLVRRRHVHWQFVGGTSSEWRWCAPLSPGAHAGSRRRSSLCGGPVAYPAIRRRKTLGATISNGRRARICGSMSRRSRSLETRYSAEPAAAVANSTLSSGSRLKL